MSRGANIKMRCEIDEFLKVLNLLVSVVSLILSRKEFQAAGAWAKQRSQNLVRVRRFMNQNRCHQMHFVVSKYTKGSAFVAGVQLWTLLGILQCCSFYCLAQLGPLRCGEGEGKYDNCNHHLLVGMLHLWFSGLDQS